ncbi:MAG: acyl-CoA dehydratase activase [Spirochaetia bacterium]|nr:acyl-CoA dehydratase activase [Spirochaetia bacterium]
MNNSRKALGICLGASTISAVCVSRDENGLKVEKTLRRHHEGNPRAAFVSVLDEIYADGMPVLITGRKFRESVNFPSITEPEASEYSLQYISGGKDYDMLVSVGGETFMAYGLDKDRRISGVYTGNKCASGTGEFFLQQIKRMGLGLEEAVAAAEAGEPYTVSGRCSVFCKSDCTHALNKGQPAGDVAAGLCRMIALKISEIIARVPHKSILVVGGTALNRAVIKYLKQQEPSVTVPKEAAYFEALGAAIAAFEKGRPAGKELFKDNGRTFSLLAPLSQAEHLVTFREMQYAKAAAGDECVIGLDVGSTTTKAVLLRRKDDKFLGSVYLRTNGNPVEASRECYRQLDAQLGGTPVRVTGIGVTGSGRHIAGLYSLTEGVINEIIAHASAAAFFDPAVDTIFEIGGQDAKYTHLTNSVASDYAMNEACSAGTGSFLEEAAQESFNVDFREIAGLALQGKNPPNFNDQCAAFISSDVKNASHEGVSREDIIAGLVYSICFNYINRVKGLREAGDRIFMQGGVCYNRAVPLAMASILNKPIIVPPEPGLMGAFGVALELKKRMDLNLVQPGEFSLKALIERQVTPEKPFTCAGGAEKCDLKCSVNRFKIDGRMYSFGGACNRYYNIKPADGGGDTGLDYVKKREELMHGKYAPVRQARPDAPSIGINKSLLAYSLFPLYYNYFTGLGCRVVVPEKMNPEALNRQTSSMCYPTQLAIGFFDELIAKNPDYYFLPQVSEMYVEGGDDRKDFSSTCIFSQGEAYWMNAVFKDKNIKDKILDPTLNFRKGYGSQKKAFAAVAKKLGFSRAESDAAYHAAVGIQIDFEKECRDIGRQALAELDKKPGSFAIVLFGRSHNAFTDEANKGIPRKIASRGHIILPFEMLDFSHENPGKPYDGMMHWEIGQKLLKASQVVKRDDRLFVLYITNFLCAIDSFLVPHVRRVMGTKPSLTLELDGHTADAGINTRIDAFLDVVKNYRQVQAGAIKTAGGGFMPSRVDAVKGRFVFTDSSGVQVDLTDPSVKVMLPSMGDLGTRGLAAAFRKVGVNAQALPVADDEVRRLGRGVLTGKECVPLVVILGSLLKYLKTQKKPGERTAIFIPKAHGYCRLGQYFTAAEMMIKDKKLRDVAPFYFAGEVGYSGMGTAFSLAAWKAIVVSDVMDDIRNAIYTLAVDREKALLLFYKEYIKIMDSISGKSGVALYKQLENTAQALSTVEKKVPYDAVPQVCVNGEIFVRRDQWCNKDIAMKLAEHGFIARHAPIHEWLFYNNYLIDKGVWEPEYSPKDWMEFYISYAVQLHTEKKIKKLLEKSGLYVGDTINAGEFHAYSEHLIAAKLSGEPGLSSGKILKDGLSHFAGHINIGPFGCMITRFTEAVVSNNLDVSDKIEAYRRAGREYDPGAFAEGDKIPFLTIEVDGNPYPQLLTAKFESFCLQAQRAAEEAGKKAVTAVK